MDGVGLGQIEIVGVKRVRCHGDHNVRWIEREAIYIVRVPEALVLLCSPVEEPKDVPDLYANCISEETCRVLLGKGGITEKNGPIIWPVSTRARLPVDEVKRVGS